MKAHSGLRWWEATDVVPGDPWGGFLWNTSQSDGGQCETNSGTKTSAPWFFALKALTALITELCLVSSSLENRYLGKNIQNCVKGKHLCMLDRDARSSLAVCACISVTRALHTFCPLLIIYMIMNHFLTSICPIVSWYSLSLVLKKDSVSWIKFPRFSSWWEIRTQRISKKPTEQQTVDFSHRTSLGSTSSYTLPCKRNLGSRLQQQTIPDDAKEWNCCICWTFPSLITQKYAAITFQTWNSFFFSPCIEHTILTASLWNSYFLIPSCYSQDHSVSIISQPTRTVPYQNALLKC